MNAVTNLLPFTLYFWSIWNVQVDAINVIRAQVWNKWASLNASRRTSQASSEWRGEQDFQTEPQDEPEEVQTMREASPTEEVAELEVGTEVVIQQRPLSLAK